MLDSCPLFSVSVHILNIIYEKYIFTSDSLFIKIWNRFILNRGGEFLIKCWSYKQMFPNDVQLLPRSEMVIHPTHWQRITISTATWLIGPVRSHQEAKIRISWDEVTHIDFHSYHINVHLTTPQIWMTNMMFNPTGWWSWISPAQNIFGEQ